MRARKAGGAEPFACDVTAPDAGERMLARGRGERFGPLDVLVNNAGTASWRDLDDVPDEDWQAAWDVNVMAPLRAMRARRPGHARARLGPRRQRLEHRRQAPVARHARVLGREGGAALALAPVRRPLRRGRRPRQRDLPRADEVGAVDRRGRPADQSAALSGLAGREEALAKAGAGRPIGRLAEVGEIAAAIVFLCSERASYVAGAAWSVDGGTVQVII